MTGFPGHYPEDWVQGSGGKWYPPGERPDYSPGREPGRYSEPEAVPDPERQAEAEIEAALPEVDLDLEGR